jgi:hypothetical protein
MSVASSVIALGADLTLIDCLALSNALGVRLAARVPALAALGLRQQCVDTLNEVHAVIIGMPVKQTEADYPTSEKGGLAEKPCRRNDRAVLHAWRGPCANCLYP